MKSALSAFILHPPLTSSIPLTFGKFRYKSRFICRCNKNNTVGEGLCARPIYINVTAYVAVIGRAHRPSPTVFS